MRLHNKFAQRLSGLGDTATTQVLTGVLQSACRAMNGTFSPDTSSGPVTSVDPIGTCYIYHAPVVAPPPAPAQVTVSPTIQTQVSPQVSPVFQQSYMPSGSPMTAGTTQTAPTSQAGTVTPTAPPDQSAALLAEQQKLMEAMLAKMSAPSAPQAPAPSAPVPMTTYTPPPQLPSAPVGMSVPSTDAAATLPQYGMSSDAQAALTAMQAGGKAPLPTAASMPAPVSPPKSNIGIMLALAAGAGVLFLAMNSKGKRHAT